MKHEEDDHTGRDSYQELLTTTHLRPISMTKVTSGSIKEIAIVPHKIIGWGHAKFTPMITMSRNMIIVCSVDILWHLYRRVLTNLIWFVQYNNRIK